MLSARHQLILEDKLREAFAKTWASHEDETAELEKFLSLVLACCEEEKLVSFGTIPVWSWHQIRQLIGEYEAAESGANFTPVKNHTVSRQICARLFVVVVVVFDLFSCNYTVYTFVLLHFLTRKIYQTLEALRYQFKGFFIMLLTVIAPEDENCSGYRVIRRQKMNMMTQVGLPPGGHKLNCYYGTHKFSLITAIQLKIGCRWMTTTDTRDSNILIGYPYNPSGLVT